MVGDRWVPVEEKRTNLFSLLPPSLVKGVSHHRYRGARRTHDPFFRNGTCNRRNRHRGTRCFRRVFLDGRGSSNGSRDGGRCGRVVGGEICDRQRYWWWSCCGSERFGGGGGGTIDRRVDGEGADQRCRYLRRPHLQSHLCNLNIGW